MKTINEILNFAFGSKQKKQPLFVSFLLEEDGSVNIQYVGELKSISDNAENLYFGYDNKRVMVTGDDFKFELEKALAGYISTHEIKPFSITGIYKGTD